MTSSKFSKEQMVEIFKHWGVYVFRRTVDSSVQNRCIILKGNQGIGKDTVVKALLRDFKPYYESTNLPGTQKDVLEIVSRLLVVHIEEFDQTKHLSDGFLKSLITQESSFFRESYGFSPNSKIMRPNFISTANVDDILRDPTGNRRFIVIPVESIGWGYPETESLQVLAEWRHLFNNGEYFTLKPETEALIKEIILEYTPQDLGDSIVDLYKSRIGQLFVKNQRNWAGANLSSGDVTEALCKISKDLSCSLRRVQSTLKSRGFSCHGKDGARYFTDPSPAAEYKAKVNAR
jgi:hypothetical protein